MSQLSFVVHKNKISVYSDVLTRYYVKNTLLIEKLHILKSRSI